MSPILLQQDNFFDDIHGVRDAVCTRGVFTDFELGLDGVTYPHINTTIANGISYEMQLKLEHALCIRISPQYVFARAMPAGCVAPAKVHSDRDMAAFTAHVCLVGGDMAATSFMTHSELGAVATASMNGTEWNSDPQHHAWQRYLVASHLPNRLLVHRAEYFHCAEPENGFGEIGQDARCVLTMFFNVL